MFIEFKSTIRQAIIDQYGTIRRFAIENQEKGYTSAKISKILNPSNDTLLSSIMGLADALNMEIRVHHKPKRA